jgi:cytochrome c556
LIPFQEDAMRKYFGLIALAALAVTFMSVTSKADDKKPAPPTKEKWMKQKLRLSQDILAGLTEADFDRIANGAVALNISNYLENWVAKGKPRHDEYELQLANFEFYNRELIRQAQDKNIDGATLAYHLMTASCVQCHKIVRDVKK